MPSAGFAFNPEDLAKLEATGTCEGCDLPDAMLQVGKLAGANLRGANLAGADLISANLGGADLSGARLTGANMIRASLQGARLDGSDLTETRDIVSLEEMLGKVIFLVTDELGNGG